jgi:hypothetical protein
LQLRLPLVFSGTAFFELPLNTTYRASVRMKKMQARILKAFFYPLSKRAIPECKAYLPLGIACNWLAPLF